MQRISVPTPEVHLDMKEEGQKRGVKSQTTSCKRVIVLSAVFSSVGKPALCIFVYRCGCAYA